MRKNIYFTRHKRVFVFIFYIIFLNQIYNLVKKFENQQESGLILYAIYVLVGVKILFLSDYPLILFVLKHRIY